MIAIAALALSAAPLSSGEGDLIPAGVINGAYARSDRVYLVEDDPELALYVARIRDQFSPGAPLLAGEEADRVEVDGVEGGDAGAAPLLVVYGTPAGLPWLGDLEDSLPFRFDDEGLLLQGRRFRGEQLRLICALRHPVDNESRIVLYTAQRAADLVGVNNIFHGPTEWLVADGERTLASGSFELTGPLSSAEARRDLEFLVGKIAAVHPAAVEGLPLAVAQRAELAQQRTAAPIERDLFWAEANAVLTALGDAHSRLAPRGGGVTFDLSLRWLREGLVADHAAGPLQRGDRIQSLGGLAEAQLLELLAERVPAETQWWLRAQGPSLLAGGFLSDAFELTEDGALPVVVLRTGERLELEVPPGPNRARTANRPWVSWEIDGASGLGVLTLDQCIDDSHYRKTLREFFQAVHDRGVRRVVVDVRRNGGGNSMVLDQFLRYLDLDEYVGYTGAVRESEDSRSQRGGDREIGYYEYGPTVKRNARVSGLASFEGQLSVLTSGATFSSGNWFAVVVQDNGLGEIVGEPTGNAPSSYGDILQFTLPKSGFAFTLSYKRWIRPDPERDPAECLEPDVLVPLERADLVRGGDPVLEFLKRRAMSEAEPR